jgi:hypothetical protein
MSRAEAERLAFESCVVEWLDANPNPSRPGQCTWCGRPETVNEMALPFGTDPVCVAWLHRECWPAWQSARTAKAIAALQAVGIQT